MIYRSSPMSDDKRDILEALKFELEFLEQGGYGRSVRKSKTPTRTFQDSLSCINFCEPTRPHPCTECFLTDFVPQNGQNEDVPCHHIPLNAEGQTVDMLQAYQLRLEEALGNWLRVTIQRLEQERAAAAKQEQA